MSTTLLDQHAERTRPRPAPPPTSQPWTVAGWAEGCFYLFYPSLPVGKVPTNTLFLTLVADQLEHDNGEAMLCDIHIEHVVAIPGIHNVIEASQARVTP